MKTHYDYYYKEKLRMKPPINFNDKRKKKEWEKWALNQ